MQWMERKIMATLSKLDEDLVFPLPFWFQIHCLWKYIIAWFYKSFSRLRIRSTKSNSNDSTQVNQVTLIIGHRGSKGTLPENSLQGFKEASTKSDGFELDIQLCKSGELVVLHDSTLDRTSTGSGLVSQFRLEELLRFTLDNGERIPTLLDVLSNFSGKTLINIEIKKESSLGSTKESALALASLLKNQDPNSIIISSFSPLALYFVKNFLPNMKIAQLISDPRTSKLKGLKGRLLGSYFYAKALRVDGVVWEKSYLLDFHKDIYQLQTKGYSVFVYTSNEEKEWEFFLNHKINGIITDFPHKAKEFIETYPDSSKNSK